MHYGTLGNPQEKTHFPSASSSRQIIHVETALVLPKVPQFQLNILPLSLSQAFYQTL